MGWHFDCRCICCQILTELEYSGVGRNKEQSARMLGHLVSNAPRLIRPYMEPILKVSYSRAIFQYNLLFYSSVCQLMHFLRSCIFARFRRISLEHGGFTNFTTPFPAASLFTQPVPGSQIVGKTQSKRNTKSWRGRSFLLFYFVFALSQFSGPSYLGAWNRLLFTSWSEQVFLSQLCRIL